MKYIEIKAPAKINIGLDVVSKRSDGYHNLETIFYPIRDLFDLLKITRSENSSTFFCNKEELNNDNNNLILSAKKILENYAERELHVDIVCEKNIPIGAGLGGGSSDAAAILISLNEMFQLGLKFEKLVKLALQLGSDVPFFIKSKPAFAKGRGEILEFVELDIESPILLINPNIHISTKEAFSNIIPKDPCFDLKSTVKESNIDFSIHKNVFKNDFENGIFSKYPILKEIKSKLYKDGAKFALMSGSGSTVYGIFDDIEKAKISLESFPQDYFKFLSEFSF